MTRLYANIAILAVATLLGVSAFLVYRWQQADIFADCRTSVVMGGQPSVGGPFELVDHHGRNVTDKDVITKPTLIYFGYTFCPDVCPTDNARNAEAVDILADKGVDVTPVFITIDPARDTPEVMAEFVEYMHPKMIGLTGSEEQIKAVSTAYRTYYRKAGEGEDYLMDHSVSTYLVLPGHGFVEHFGRSVSPDEMADTVACFAERS